MSRLLETLTARRTWLAFVYLLSAAPLSAVWFGLLLAGWLSAGLLAVTPLIVPTLILFRGGTRLAAELEAALARGLLGADVRTPASPPPLKGYWGRIRTSLADARFWTQQVFLTLRMLLGGALAIGVVSLLGAGLGLIATPITYRFDAQELGFWTIDTIGEALAVVPLGVVVLVVSILLFRPLGAMWSRLALSLLGDAQAGTPRAGAVAAAFRRSLPVHAAFYAGLNALLVAVWALTTRGYFWPMWTLLPLGAILLAHAWIVVALERFRDRAALAIHAGVEGSIGLLLVGIWAVTTRGYFWPAWPTLGLAVVVGAHAAAEAIWGGRAALTERIDVLTTTRAGAVDAAEAELRRIERDLHDGAQARLVALGMSIGMAEQKLAEDPDAARELLAEARAGAGEALKELRDLARGIHPPVLTDRGLAAALAALTARTPLPVDVAVDVPERPAEPVEAAAYFVVAESLTNAAKHAAASRVEIRIAREGDTLTVEVADDGRGGAQPGGNGLSGIRRRVEALDGTLEVVSPPGAGTLVKAVLPCAS